MNQILTVTVPVQIPDGMKLVPDGTHGYDGESLTGRTWTAKDLRAWCGNKSWPWLLDNILENPVYSREIGYMEQHKQLVHRGMKGSPWRFKAKPMAEFLDRHWEEFPW